MSIHRFAAGYLRERLKAGLGLPAYLERNRRRDYIERTIRATLDGISPADFKKLLIERDWKTRCTGVPHVLDHIIPLHHPRVCGLNVPWNVAVIPKATNARKSNHWCQWHGDLFDDNEQLVLP